MIKKLSILLAAMLATSVAQAESRLPFMKDIAGDRELPLPWGISLDFYTMDQEYELDRLEFTLPGVTLTDTSLLDVTNSVQHFDLKLDAWVLPFLNVFVVAGFLDAKTDVDISRANLPLPVKAFPVSYDGTVYGAGVTLAVGGDRWFSSLTATTTDTSLDGGFNSSVSSLTLQPRIGLVNNDWQFWVGGLYLDTDESHQGNISIPTIGNIDFAVDLSEGEQFNVSVGARHQISERIDISFEVGFGDRDHTLLNVGYRF